MYVLLPSRNMGGMSISKPASNQRTPMIFFDSRTLPGSLIINISYLSFSKSSANRDTIPLYCCLSNGRFGSQAAPFVNINLTAASGSKADVPQIKN